MLEDPPPGHYRLPGEGGTVRKHQSRCLCCARMTESSQFQCPATRRLYTIRNWFYDCTSRWVIYVCYCTTHSECLYVGQTVDGRGMYGRHAHHREEIKLGKGGLGEHYHSQHSDSTDTLQITIIDSVKPGNHALLDQKEERWMYNLRALDFMGYGGLNKRDDLDRNRERCNCKFCKTNQNRTVGSN